jgi:beta-galactosidase
MVAELYPGWLTHWAEPFPVTPVDSFLPAYDSMLKRGVSINLYMFHGGTNFGFTSGANYTRALPIEPSMTSYDYDAPLSEAGWPTPKYYALRDVIRRDVSYAIPDVPAALPVIAVPPVRLTAVSDLTGIIDRVTPVIAAQPMSFEDLDQASGYVLYRHRFNSATNGVLRVPGLRDYAAVMVDGRRVATLDRRTKSFSAPVAIPAGGRLDILVENMGRINYGSALVSDRKGIIEPVTIESAGDTTEITGWSMYRLPFGSVPRLTTMRGKTSASAGIPTLYRGTFTVTRTGDTFLDMREWNKGIIFVNGINLGRYWNVGPQQTLYLPGAWLHKGRNSIVVFELNGHDGAPEITGLTQPILTQLNAGPPSR